MTPPQQIRHPDRFFSISFGGFKQSGIGREGGTEGMYPYRQDDHPR